jgi:hypothetical protein
VRGGGKRLAVGGVATVGTSMGSTAAYLYLRNQREEQIKNAIRNFRDIYQNASYVTFKQILDDGYGLESYNYEEENQKYIKSFLDSQNTDIDNKSVVSDLLLVNFKSDNVANLFQQISTITRNIVTLLIALFIKDCGFATAFLLQKSGDITQIEVYFLRQNLNIVALYVQDNSPTTTEIERKSKFIKKYKDLYKTPQISTHIILDDREQKEVSIEGGHLFDTINNVPEIKNLKCLITPGAYDSFLGSYDTVSRTLGSLHRKSGAGITGGPVLGL